MRLTLQSPLHVQPCILRAMCRGTALSAGQHAPQQRSEAGTWGPICCAPRARSPLAPKTSRSPSSIQLMLPTMPATDGSVIVGNTNGMDWSEWDALLARGGQALGVQHMSAQPATFRCRRVPACRAVTRAAVPLATGWLRGQQPVQVRAGLRPRGSYLEAAADQGGEGLHVELGADARLLHDAAVD